MPELRLDLRRLADQITDVTAALEATRDTVLLERVAAEDPIIAAVAAARAQDELAAAKDTLDVGRQDQVTTRDTKRRPRPRRALGPTCQAIATFGGAGLGAFSGPIGAMIGVGVIGGKLTCR